VFATVGGQKAVGMLRHRRRGWLLVGVTGLLLAYLVLPVAGASAAEADTTYVVVLKGNTQAGLAAVEQAGGQFAR
jgi:succinate dehydrogenase hydrophobic anchor subunit